MFSAVKFSMIVYIVFGTVAQLLSLSHDIYVSNYIYIIMLQK
jgi:hypothetical protein